MEESEYTKFMMLPDRTRTDKVYALLDFDVAGEQQNKRLLFYLLLGSYVPNLAPFIIYRGDSSGGKSHVANDVLKLFPAKHVLYFDSATAAALKYDEAMADAKIIYLRELAEGDTMDEILKGFYNTGGFIHKETVRDPKTKEFVVKTHVFEKKAIITTFSFENTRIDLVNRSWVMTPDQKYEQTSKIIAHKLRVQRRLIERTIEAKQVDQDRTFLAKSLEVLDYNFEVFICYIDRIQSLFPSDYLNVRRDVDKLVNLIKIITIWNQKNRRSVSVGDHKFLLAEYYDLREALEVCETLFIDQVLHIDETKRQILDFMVNNEVKQTVSAKDVDKFLGKGSDDSADALFEEIERYYTISEVYQELISTSAVSRKTVQRKMDDLYREGYLFRDKSKGAWRYQKLRGYDLIKHINLNRVAEEITDQVDQQYIYYKDKTEADIKEEIKLYNS